MDNHYTDRQLQNIIAEGIRQSPVSGDTDLASDMINAAWLASMIGVEPTRYLRVASIALRDLGYRSAASLVKAEYYKLVESED